VEYWEPAEAVDPKMEIAVLAAEMLEIHSME